MKDAERGRNINDWANVLRPYDHVLADRLGTRRDASYRAVRELGLPMFKMEQCTLSDFLKSPETVFDKFDSDRYVVTLIPKDSSLTRYSEPAITRSETLEFIKLNILQSSTDQYEILMLPYYDVRYGGNISVNAHNELFVEFRDGLPGPVSYGTETPAYSATRDPFLGSLKYNFEDERLRQEMAAVLSNLPHQGAGRDIAFRPGYYEFVLVQKDKLNKDKLDLSFIDYREDQSYQVDIDNEHAS